MQTQTLLNTEGAFNGDTSLEEQVLKLQKQFKLTVAIETGTYHGETTAWLGDHFKTVFTIESQQSYYDIARQNLKKYTNIVQLLGDSSKVIKNILEGLQGTPFIFLDAHWYKNPLLGELQMIKQSGIIPVLAIHDFKNPFNPEYGFDEYKEQGIIYNWEYIEKSIKGIYNNGFAVAYNENATGAKRGCIFITPKQ